MTWVHGLFGNWWSWEAKVYEQPSHNGIDNGRISKMCLYDGDHRTLAQFDRGEWVPAPKGEEVNYYWQEAMNNAIAQHDAIQTSAWYQDEKRQEEGRSSSNFWGGDGSFWNTHDSPWC